MSLSDRIARGPASGRENLDAGDPQSIAAELTIRAYGRDAVIRTIADARGIAVSPFLRRAASGTLPGKVVR